MSDFYKRENPHRLFRDKENAVIAGVCAGIADYAGLNRRGTRIAIALLTLAVANRRPRNAASSE